MNGLYALINSMLDKIYNDGERVFGDIVYAARCEIIQQYFPTQSMYGPAVIYATLGDPALRLKYPSFPGKVESEITPIEKEDFKTLIISGPLILPQGNKCRVFNISGREVISKELKPGIYFVEIDGELSWKVIKIE